MNKKKTFDIHSIDSTALLTEEHLTGGFSLSFSIGNSTGEKGGESNNCLGGNCSYACGYGQNVHCNYSAGCKN